MASTRPTGLRPRIGVARAVAALALCLGVVSASPPAEAQRPGARAKPASRVKPASRATLRGGARPAVRRRPARLRRGERTRRLVQHIARTDRDLVRTSGEAALAGDPKFLLGKNDVVLYVPPRENLARIRRELRSKVGERADDIELRRLGKDGVPRGHESSVLYLPEAYPVPGGRFVEMYGWDSYFMQKGVLRAGRQKLARGITDNHLYQVEHYGKVLNASRAWSLTRSQPPLLTRMVSDVYGRTGDRAWLDGAYAACRKYYLFWNRGTRSTPSTGLSRFYDDGDGAAPEVEASGPEEYEATKEFFRQRGRTEDVSRYYDAATDSLTSEYFKGERAGRESGYDTSSRFGPFNADTHHYNPVDLNSMLYVMETDMARFASELGRPRVAQAWRRRANERRERINELMWDGKAGLYFDYDTVRNKKSDVVFASTFVPLWAGVATPEQARRLVEKALPRFETEWGLQTSVHSSGHQWDAPMGWAPLTYFAIKGLRRYGYHREADRLSVKYLSLILKEYERTGGVYEKYNVVEGHSDTARSVRYGYTTNEAGFGWTNGVALELLADLPARKREQLERRARSVGATRPSPD